MILATDSRLRALRTLRRSEAMRRATDSRLRELRTLRRSEAM
jgi:hypothetical protein